MTYAQRVRLHDLMMCGVGPDEPAYEILSEAVTEDLDMIEPAIDEMIQDAHERNFASTVEAKPTVHTGQI
jgi:hypothetical protein